MSTAEPCLRAKATPCCSCAEMASVVRVSSGRHLAKHAPVKCLGLGRGHGGGTGAAVDEEQVAPLQLCHQPGHGLGLGGHAAAHMIVDAGGEGHFGQGGIQAAGELFDRGAWVPGVRAGGRVHGHVQDHRAPGFVGLAGEVGGMGRIGHDSHRDRARQGEGAAVALAALAQVVDDDAHVGLGRRRMGGAGQQAEQRQQQVTHETGQSPLVMFRPLSRLRAWLSWKSPSCGRSLRLLLPVGRSAPPLPLPRWPCRSAS